MLFRSASGNLVTEDGLELLEHELDRTKAKRAAKRPAPSRQASQAHAFAANALWQTGRYLVKFALEAAFAAKAVLLNAECWSHDLTLAGIDPSSSSLMKQCRLKRLRVTQHHGAGRQHEYKRNALSKGVL